MRYCVFLVVCLLLSGCTHTSREEYDIPGPTLRSHEEQYEVVLAYLSESIKSNPSNALNYYKRAWWQYQEGNYEEALVDITRAERLSPNSPEILYIKSAILYKCGRDNALENALFAEDQEFESPELYTLIGNLYLDRLNVKKAGEYFRKAENIYPYSSGLLNGLGRYHALLRDTVTAIQFYKKAVDSRPGVFEYYDDLIKIYGKARQVDSAMHYNNIAIARFPEKTDLRYQKGYILEETGLLDSALLVYRRVLRLEPQRADIYERIGNIQFRKRDYSAAFVSYNKWAEMEPENVLARLKAARSYIAQHNLPAARYYLEKALEKHPDNTLLPAELNAVKYRITAEAFNSSAISNLEKPKEKDEGRIFDRSLQINKIQKRKPVLIGRDSTGYK